MSFIYERFESVVIPLLDPVHPIGTGESPRPLVHLANGIYDPIGNELAPPDEQAIAVRGTIKEDTAAARDAVLRDWRQLRGRRGKLYRRWDASQVVEWAWCDLRSIDGDRIPVDCDTQEIALNFVMQSPHWNGPHRGPGWRLDDGHRLDEGYRLDEHDTYSIPVGIANTVIPYGGTATLTAIKLTFTNGPGAPPISSLAIKVGPDYSGDTSADYFETNVIYGGVVPAGGVLVIDGGAKRVTVNGAGDYANFVISGLHTIDSWIRFLPEVNAIISTNMAGGAGVTMHVEFWGGNP